MKHEIITSEQVPFTYQVAGLGSRLLANLVDMILVILLMLIGALAGIIFDRRRPSPGCRSSRSCCCRS